MPGRDQPQDPSSPPPAGDDRQGIRDTFTSFASGFRTYLEARRELFAIESREAAAFAGRKAAHGGILAACLFFAYALLLVSGVSLAGHWLGTILPGAWANFGWQTAAAAAALLHLVVVAVCYKALRKQPDQPLFEVTRNEFQNDRQWLQDQQNKSESNN